MTETDAIDLVKALRFDAWPKSLVPDLRGLLQEQALQTALFHGAGDGTATVSDLTVFQRANPTDGRPMYGWKFSLTRAEGSVAEYGDCIIDHQEPGPMSADHKPHLSQFLSGDDTATPAQQDLPPLTAPDTKDADHDGDTPPPGQ